MSEAKKCENDAKIREKKFRKDAKYEISQKNQFRETRK